MARTRSTNGTVRGTREIAEAQRDRYEALADNFAALQRRGVKFAEDGIEVLKLQESNAKAAQKWWADGMRLLELQQRNVRFVQNWLTGGVGFLQEQTEHNRRTAEVFVESVQKQQEGFRKLTEGWIGAYQDFFFSPFTYAQESLRAAERATRQGLETTQKATREGLRLAEESAEQTEEAIEQAEKAIREVELRAVVHGALKTADYEKLSVEDVSKKLDGLTVEEIKQVREYEKRSHNRQTLIDQIDQKIRAKS